MPTVKLPAFQVYPGDWRKDLGVQSLSYHDRGVWWELICLMHESERRGLLVLNGRAMSNESIARLLGLDNQTITTTLTTLLTSGVASRDEETGALMCRRIVRDEKTRQLRAEAGKLGGNPALLNHEVNQKPTTGDKQIPTPSSSSSVSTTEPPKNKSAFAPPSWILQSTWDDFEEMRKKIRKPMTDKARQNVIAKLDEFRARGHDPNAVLNNSITNSWVGIWEPREEGANGASRARTKTDGNIEAAKRAINYFHRAAADGAGGSEAGGGERNDLSAVREASG